MIALRPTEYLLLREVARLTGVSDQILRRQVKAGLIPAQFVMKSGTVRPVIRIHRSWVERSATPAVTCEAVIPWGPR